MHNARKTLANIYEKWGNRLLEKNVRVFLQAKGKVNKGIRETIEKEPNMFLDITMGLQQLLLKLNIQLPNMVLLFQN